MKKENIFLLKFFVTFCLIEKLLESWKDYIKTSKYRKKQLSFEDAIIHIRIKEKNRVRDASDKGKKHIAKKKGHCFICGRNMLINPRIKLNKGEQQKSS